MNHLKFLDDRLRFQRDKTRRYQACLFNPRRDGSIRLPVFN
jgi:hypothetical protein